MSNLLESYDTIEDVLTPRAQRIFEAQGFNDLDELVDAAARGANFKTFDGIGRSTHNAIYDVADQWDRNTTLNQIAEQNKGGDRFRRIARSKGLHTAKAILDYYADGGRPFHLNHSGFGPHAEVECLKSAIQLAQVDEVDEPSTVDDGEVVG